MPNSKLTEDSPFLQDEVAFATPERETEYGGSGLASPFLSDEPLQTFTAGDQEAWNEPEYDAIGLGRPRRRSRKANACRAAR